jgi:PAS domain S-box-containing protein
MDPRDHYAALIASSDDGIIAKDLSGVVISWNPAAAHLFGWTESEMVGRSIRRLLPADRHAEGDAILARIGAGERVPAFLTRRLHRDGHELDVEVSVSPVRDPAGAIVGASTIMRDATERVLAEQRLRQSEARFRMLGENMSQLAWIAEADGAIRWYNQRWYQYTGTTPDEMQELGWPHFHRPDHLDRVYSRFFSCVARGVEWEDIFPLRRADGEWRWFLGRAKPIRDDAGKVTNWFGTNTDITEQREQAEQIQLLLQEVNHRSKNMLAKVQALARSSIRADPALVRRFEERVGSLAVNQDILVRRDWREVPVRELAELQLAFVSAREDVIVLDGPDCALNPRAAEVIGMALHELATNSIKYGALSVEGGVVSITWEAGDDAFAVEWTESGGPPVEPPLHNGFGTQLIRDIPRRSFAAEVSLEYPVDGLCWRFASDARVLASNAASAG